MRIPRGYETKKRGAVWKIYDSETGEQVSPGYHSINFPRVKVGAHKTRLIKYDGYFIPRELSAAKRQRLYDGDRGRWNNQFDNSDLEEALLDYHGTENEDNPRESPFSRFSPDTSRQDVSKYGLMNPAAYPHGKQNADDSDSEKYSSLSMDKDDFLVVIEATLRGLWSDSDTGCRKRDYQYIVDGYPELEEVLNEVDSSEDVRKLREELPFSIDDEDLESIHKETVVETNGQTLLQ